jgi:hypothetical protein
MNYFLELEGVSGGRKLVGSRQGYAFLEDAMRDATNILDQHRQGEVNVLQLIHKVKKGKENADSK